MLDFSSGPCYESASALGREALAEEVGEPSNAVVLRDFLTANYSRLHQRLQRFLGDPDLASDSLHDAWLRLGEMDAGVAVQSPGAYIYRVACNLATDRLRRNRAWQYTNDAYVELDEFVDPAPGPDSIAEVRFKLAALDRAMHELPGRLRAVLMSLRIYGMTRTEVAVRYSLSPRRVDTALREAVAYCVERTGGAGMHNEGCD